LTSSYALNSAKILHTATGATTYNAFVTASATGITSEARSNGGSIFYSGKLDITRTDIAIDSFYSQSGYAPTSSAYVKFGGGSGTAYLNLYCRDTINITGEDGVNVVGTLKATGSLFGTSSYAATASYAITSSYVSYPTTGSTGTGSATLTNSPVSGNPAGWLDVTIAGVVRKMPYW
jgi:hypothetical protein